MTTNEPVFPSKINFSSTDTYIKKDGSDMKFKDLNNSESTLTQLLAGSSLATLSTDIKVFGFVDNTETTISFNDSTYTFSLTRTGASFRYYRAGVLYTISADKTVVLPGTPPTAGTYYIYIDATDGTLSQSTSPWSLTTGTAVPVALIHWNNSNTPKYLLGDERHPCTMLRTEHAYLHATVGTKLSSGGAVTGANYTNPSGSSNADNTFGIAETTIWDESLRIVLSALTDPAGSGTDYLAIYPASSWSWTWSQSGVPFLPNSVAYIQYYKESTATMEPGQQSKYYNWYLMATHHSGNERFIMTPGRQEFASLATAQAEKFGDLLFTNFPVQEAVALYQFTFTTSNSYTTKGKCVLAAAPVKIAASITSAGSIPGYGTMAVQNADSVNISGGVITGTTIGSTSLAANQTVLLGDKLGTYALEVKNSDGTQVAKIDSYGDLTSRYWHSTAHTGAGYLLYSQSTGYFNTSSALTFTSGRLLTITAGVPALELYHADDTPTNYAHVRAFRSRASGAAAQAGDGIVAFEGYGRTNALYIAAQIIISCDTGWGSTGTDAPGKITFTTTPDGSSTPVEHLSINAAGDITATLGDNAGVRKLYVNDSGSATVASIDSDGAITSTSLTASGLTSTRIPIAGSGGLLGDSASLTYSGGTLTVSNGTASASTLVVKDNATTVFEVADGGGVAATSDAGVSVRAADATEGVRWRTLHRNTTDATQTELTFDGAAVSGTTNTLQLANSTTHLYVVHITARATAGTNSGKSAAWRLEYVGDGASGTAVVVGSVTTTVITVNGMTWTVTASFTSARTQILVTGDASTTIHWTAIVQETTVA